MSCDWVTQKRLEDRLAGKRSHWICECDECLCGSSFGLPIKERTEKEPDKARERSEP